MAILKKARYLIDQEVQVGSLNLEGHLFIPESPIGIVIFAHGSGSSRFSRRNNQVAETLHNSAIGTLVFDLLTVEEENDRRNVFDIELLADRLDEAKRWILDIPESHGLSVGYFGASTGAGAALVAAANSPDGIGAIVSRGGRPDLAENALREVKAPTLLMVGEADDYVIELNKKAFDQLSCEKSLEIVPGASHLFPEPGALERVSELASKWFSKYL